MSGPRRVLVTGGTGTTGSRVAQRLARTGTEAVVASRTPGTAADLEHVRFDWHDPSPAADALRTGGYDAVYLVAPPRDPDPVRAMGPLLETAAGAGVRRAVLLGAKPVRAGDRGLGRVYDAVSATFDEWAVLRPTWFMQDFVADHYLAAMVRDGTLLTASTAARIAYIDADDVAAVAAALLIQDEFRSREYVLTGPEALPTEETGAMLTQVLGRAIEVQHVSEAVLADRLGRTLPPLLAGALAHADATYTDEAVTDDVLRVTMRPPRSFRAFLLDALRDPA